MINRRAGILIGLLGFMAAGLVVHLVSGWPPLPKAVLAALVALAVSLLVWLWLRRD
jgi:hypothetical protein